jgi:hypothetical protein
MKFTSRLTGLAASAAALCFTLSVATGKAPWSPNSGHAQGPQAPQKSVADYAAELAPLVAFRPITLTERTSVETGGAAALEPLLRKWIQEPQFLESVRLFVEKRYSLGGEANGINYDEPVDLAVYLHRNSRPWSEFITSEICVDGTGKQKACDHGAPFTAGALTSRAFLAQHAGAFNISRSAKLLGKFTCQEYPVSPALEPPVPKSELIELFASPNGAITFGNGTDCASCHSQFAKHAQLFVKFDASGRYRVSATGLQDPNPQAAGGSSTNGTYVSHFHAAERAGREASEMFGRPVANLAEAARVIVAHPSYYECAARNILRHYLRLGDTTTRSIPSALASGIAANARARSAAPSFGELFVSSLAHPAVIESYTAHGKRGE